MKKIILLSIFFFLLSNLKAQQSTINHDNILEDLDEIINDIEQNYVYLDNKKVDLSCIKEYYKSQIKGVKSEEETVLLFEYLLDEFYDSHINLRTHRNSSYRLYSPIYASITKGRIVISNVWQTQIENLDRDIIGAEIISINGIEFEQAIERFPTHCNDKTDPETREWIANSILAGRYNEARLLKLRLRNEEIIELDLDNLIIKNHERLLQFQIADNIGVIRINNSLGNDNLVVQFDQALDGLMHTKGLILDLRNTINGGDSYEARGIMGRFIEEAKPYQKHEFFEKSLSSVENPKVKRSWIEYVYPRLESYKKPLVVLVGRWTGSMGEGLAVGFEGMGRAEIVGSEMRRLAGEVFDFGFINQTYGYKLSTAKLYHVNGTLREKYVPTNYVMQTTNTRDEVLEKGMSIINEFNKLSIKELKSRLESLAVRDQTLRLLLPEVETQFGRSSDEYKHVWFLIHQQDEEVLNELIGIIDSYGWLGKSKVGEQANQAIWLIMQHAKLEIQLRYLPLLEESVELGESEGWHFAYLQDRILMRQGKFQLYGTQAVWDNVSERNVIYQFDDLEDVNQRRKGLGMKSLQEYASLNNYELKLVK